MKKSLIALIAVAALSMAAVAVSSVTYYAVHCWRRASGWISNGVDFLLSKIAPADAAHLAAPRRALLGAVQYAGRMIRRDRPVMESRWRMCPSV